MYGVLDGLNVLGRCLSDSASNSGTVARVLVHAGIINTHAHTRNYIVYITNQQVAFSLSCVCYYALDPHVMIAIHNYVYVCVLRHLIHFGIQNSGWRTIDVLLSVLVQCGVRFVSSAPCF